MQIPATLTTLPNLLTLGRIAAIPVICLFIALGWGCVALLGYLIGLSYAAKQENFGEVKNVWPLLCLALPFVGAIWVRDAVSGGLLLVFAAWTLYSLSWLMRRQQRNIPRAIGHFIAGSLELH